MAPVPANATAKWVQSFDPAATDSEQPPQVPGTGRGSPKPDVWPKAAAEADTNNPSDPRLLIDLNEWANIRADNQVLTRETPESRKRLKNAWGRNIRSYPEPRG